MEIMNAISTESLLLVGIAISGAAFLWKIQHSLKNDFSDLRKDFSDLRKEVNSLAQRIAKIEGLLMPTPNIDQSHLSRKL